jgi:hypothetical protein
MAVWVVMQLPYGKRGKLPIVCVPIRGMISDFHVDMHLGCRCKWEGSGPDVQEGRALAVSEENGS